MRFLVSASAIALVCEISADASAQGRGGGCNRASGSTGGATAVAGGSAVTGPELFSGSSSSPSPTAIMQSQMRLMAQMQRQQLYFAQVQAYAQRQQADAAKKAAKKEAQIASRKARREAELARRAGSASRTSLASNDTAFPALRDRSCRTNASDIASRRPIDGETHNGDRLSNRGRPPCFISAWPLRMTEQYLPHVAGGVALSGIERTGGN